MLNITNKKITTNVKNVDAQEIERFNKFALQWWNVTGIFKSLHYINSIRLDYIIEYSNGLFGKTVLDVGCGGGLLSESMAKKGAKVIGLDMSPDLLEVAKSHALSQKLAINYILETVEEHALNHLDYYDIVTCMEVLEHVPNPSLIVRACSSITKIGGSVFFSTLNRTLKSWLLAIIGAEYLLHLIPKGTHKFKKFIVPSELLSWIDLTSLKGNNITGVYYNPFTNKCMRTNDISVNYILHAQRDKRSNI